MQGHLETGLAPAAHAGWCPAHLFSRGDVRACYPCICAGSWPRHLLTTILSICSNVGSRGYQMREQTVLSKEPCSLSNWCCHKYAHTDVGPRLADCVQVQ